MNDKLLLLIVLVLLLAVLILFHGSNMQAAIEQWITGVLGGILVLTRSQATSKQAKVEAEIVNVDQSK